MTTILNVEFNIYTSYFYILYTTIEVNLEYFSFWTVDTIIIIIELLIGKLRSDFLNYVNR